MFGEWSLGDQLILGGEPVERCSIEQAVCRLLSPWIDAPLYRTRPQGIHNYPVVTYELTKNDYQNWLTGKNGLAEATFEFHIYSDVYDDLATVGEQIRAILDAYAGPASSRTIHTALHQNETDAVVIEKGNTLYVRSQEFTILYEE